jgi:surface antigen
VVYAPAPRIVYLPSPETYVILREGRDSQGHLCREFQRAGTIDGQPVQLYGVACLRPDGQWQIVN